ncbi:MAG: hypothetical protein GY726_07310 [Proteobacteria bacterium]|nr:hypothetical protein [Pseudomonadota bacterium]
MSKSLSSACPGVVLFIMLLLCGAASAATIGRHDQTASGLQGWRVQDENIKIELNPLQKDQVRAFYLGRGFSEILTERIADSCVYQTVIENVSTPNRDTQLEVDLSDWRLNGKPGGVALRSKEKWIQEWTTSGASVASILAFKWATFPTLQYFKLTGDYGWGMILFGKQTAKTFDLLLKWTTDGEPEEQLVRGLSCPD